MRRTRLTPGLRRSPSFGWEVHSWAVELQLIECERVHGLLVRGNGVVSFVFAIHLLFRVRVHDAGVALYATVGQDAAVVRRCVFGIDVVYLWHEIVEDLAHLARVGGPRVDGELNGGTSTTFIARVEIEGRYGPRGLIWHREGVESYRRQD